MSSPILFHTSHSIKCSKIINQIIKGEKYIQYYNQYLIPYHCHTINQENRMIFGRFIHPLFRNTLERTILARGTVFSHSYIKGNEFIFEVNPSTFKEYHIFGQTFIYANGIQVCEHTLKPNSILLFPIDKTIAEPLIINQLL